MRKINNVKELVDFAYNKYKTKKAITIESDYIKNINYFNFRFDIYSMARAIQSKENQIRNNKIAIAKIIGITPPGLSLNGIKEFMPP